MKRHAPSKPKMGWYLNLQDGAITYEPIEKYEGANWGDYHHHDMEGPFLSPAQAYQDATERWGFDIRMAKPRLSRAKRDCALFPVVKTKGKK